MTLEQLRIFVCVADRLNMTRAAEELHITQSGVSASISALENTYGAALFDRVGRRIELSAAGQVFRIEAEKVLRQAALAQRALLDLSDLRRGTVSVCASQTVGNYVLPVAIARFRARWPSLAVALHIADTAGAVRMLADGKADIALVEGQHREAGLVRQEIRGDRIGVFVWPQHPWATRRPSPGELAAGGWVLPEPGSGARSEFLHGMETLGVAAADLDIHLELPTNEAVRAAVQAGAGPGVLSELVVADAVAAGTLARVDVDLPARTFSLLRRAERPLSRAADVFARTITAAPAACERPGPRRADDALARLIA